MSAEAIGLSSRRDWAWLLAGLAVVYAVLQGAAAALGSALELDAKNAQGRVVNWALEIPAPNVVARNGFDRTIYQTLMNSGEEVTVTAYAAWDGSKHAWAGGLTRADGLTVISLSGIPGQGGGGRRGGGPPPQ